MVLQEDKPAGGAEEAGSSVGLTGRQGQTCRPQVHSGVPRQIASAMPRKPAIAVAADLWIKRIIHAVVYRQPLVQARIVNTIDPFVGGLTTTALRPVLVHPPIYTGAGTLAPPTGPIIRGRTAAAARAGASRSHRSRALPRARRSASCRAARIWARPITTRVIRSATNPGGYGNSSRGRAQRATFLASASDVARPISVQSSSRTRGIRQGSLPGRRRIGYWQRPARHGLFRAVENLSEPCATACRAIDAAGRAVMRCTPRMISQGTPHPLCEADCQVRQPNHHLSL